MWVKKSGSPWKTALRSAALMVKKEKNPVQEQWQNIVTQPRYLIFKIKKIDI